MEINKQAYLVTEDQLLELQALVWGAQMTKEGEPERFNALIRKIREQALTK